MATIGIMDSGVGGLSVLREILKVLPTEKFIYFSDNAYCPYGEKKASLILERARAVTDIMLTRGADIVVIACNTATAAAIASLRKEYSAPNEKVKALTGGRRDHISFIGMEPAVKPAALGTRNGIIGVLATAGTLSGSKYLDMKSLFEGDVRIIEQVGRGFVELVERGELEGDNAMETVRASVLPLVDAGADTIVLGCTHYPFLRKLIEKAAGPGVNVIDPAPAVARHLCDVISLEHIRTGETASEHPDVTLISSGPSEALQRTFGIITKHGLNTDNKPAQVS